MNTLHTDIVEIVAEITSYDTHEVETDTPIIDDLGFDSIMLMDLYASLAKKYPEIRSLDATSSVRDGMTIDDLERDLRAVIGGETAEPEERQPMRIADMDHVQSYRSMLRNLGDVPYFEPHEGIAANTMSLNGTDFVNYSSYNYLGTNGHPRITAAVHEAVQTYGTSVSAARIIGGEIPLHRELEREIAQFVGAEDSVSLIGGHTTNVNALGHLFGEEDLILHDALAHNSLVQGALLSGAKRKPFRHNDLASLRKELSRLRRKFRYVVIVVEGVYSMDGDMCPLPEILDIKEEFDAFLMVDEAHSIGTIGSAGRGVTSHFGVDPARVDILMGTLSKAFNSCGGYLAGSAEFIEYLRYTLPGFIFSVGTTPANTAAALESIRLCQENPQWIDELGIVSKKFLSGVKEMGFDTGLSADTPVVPVITGDSQQALKLSGDLYKLGVHVSPVMAPAVAEDEARLRFFLSRSHTDDDLRMTFDALSQVR